MNKFVSGGHFGDVIHILYAIKKIYESTNVKGELCLSDTLVPKSFKRPVELICEEIKEILLKQEYISNIVSNVEKDVEYVNLSAWRHSNFLFKTCWTEMLSNVYNLPAPTDKIKPWINFDKKNQLYSDKILIHQSAVNFRKSKSFPWENIINNNKCLFITYSNIEYELFKYKNIVDVVYMKDFEECCTLLNSCKFYVGNLTSITAIAHAMGVPRLVELSNADSIHYKDEYKYFDNFYYISEYHNNSYLDGIEKYIQI